MDPDEGLIYVVIFMSRFAKYFANRFQMMGWWIVESVSFLSMQAFHCPTVHEKYEQAVWVAL